MNPNKTLTFSQLIHVITHAENQEKRLTGKSRDVLLLLF